MSASGFTVDLAVHRLIWNLDGGGLYNCLVVGVELVICCTPIRDQVHLVMFEQFRRVSQGVGCTLPGGAVDCLGHNFQHMAELQGMRQIARVLC